MVAAAVLLFYLFFLHRLANIIAAFLVAAGSLLVTQPVHPAVAAAYHNPVPDIINFTAVFIIVFTTLYHVKQVLHEYEMEITGQKQLLEELNYDIMAQQAELFKQARNIEHKKQEITGLNNIRNKLISIMSHDVKTPVYSLSNIFRHVQPASPGSGKVLRATIPQINTELDNTITLIENLLAWSKQNIATVTGTPAEIDINRIAGEVISFLSLQALQKGGDITFYSEEGKGTLFTFSIPLNKAPFRKQFIHA